MATQLFKLTFNLRVEALHYTLDGAQLFENSEEIQLRTHIFSAFSACRQESHSSPLHTGLKQYERWQPESHYPDLFRILPLSKTGT